ncbi:hypothetical protein DFH09DRAFT_1375526 [Mycena vulgaris]|nr:hypothetical protein DFH09DRAFT_1375526 [Mycena vulgaris]
MAAIGIWLWLDTGKFGSPIPCVPTLTIVGGPAPFSSPPLRIFSLTIYFLLLIPGINLLPPIFFFLGLHIAYNWSRENHSSFWERWNRCIQRIRKKLSRKEHPELVDGESQIHNTFLIVGLVLFVINIIFLVDIELTFSRNKHLQVDGDDLWGFGQVLALLLLVVPLRDAWNALRDVQSGLRGVQQQFHQVLREELAATPIVDRLRVLIAQNADPKRPIEGTGFGNSLQLAAYLGRKDIVEFLLSNEVRMIETEASGDYGTALQVASAKGHEGIVQLLLEQEDYRKYMDIEGGHYGTAFCASCANGELGVAKLLFEKRVAFSPDKDIFGPPLHIASLMGEISIIRWLLEHEDGSSTWADYGTALDVAVAVGESEVERNLRESGLQEVVSCIAALLCLCCMPDTDHSACSLVPKATLLPSSHRSALTSSYRAAFGLVPQTSAFALVSQRHFGCRPTGRSKSHGVSAACPMLITAPSPRPTAPHLASSHSDTFALVQQKRFCHRPTGTPLPSSQRLSQRFFPYLKGNRELHYVTAACLRLTTALLPSSHSFTFNLVSQTRFGPCSTDCKLHCVSAVSPMLTRALLSLSHSDAFSLVPKGHFALIPQERFSLVPKARFCSRSTDSLLTSSYRAAFDLVPQISTFALVPQRHFCCCPTGTVLPSSHSSTFAIVPQEHFCLRHIATLLPSSHRDAFSLVPKAWFCPRPTDCQSHCVSAACPMLTTALLPSFQRYAFALVLQLGSKSHGVSAACPMLTTAPLPSSHSDAFSVAPKARLSLIPQERFFPRPKGTLFPSSHSSTFVPRLTASKLHCFSTTAPWLTEFLPPVEQEKRAELLKAQKLGTTEFLPPVE